MKRPGTPAFDCPLPSAWQRGVEVALGGETGKVFGDLKRDGLGGDALWPVLRGDHQSRAAADQRR
jgi:hypothetical protein